MARRSWSRRQFLRRVGGSAGVAAIGLGGASALELASPSAAAGAPQGQHEVNAHEGRPAARPPTESQVIPRPDAQYYVFFNEDQAATVEAIAERLWPGAPGKPGARDANVRHYLDLALAGAYADQQDFYRRGLAALDELTQGRYGQPFRQLAPEQQDDVLLALERGEAPEFTFPSAQAFFNRLWVHAIEGMFADPVYGGNENFAGWRLVEFPGAQFRYLSGDMQANARFTRAPILGLQQQYEQRLSQARGE